MTTKQKLELMGKIVTVKKVLFKTYEFDNDESTLWKTCKKRWKERNIEPRAGWVVGFRTVYEGEYNYFSSESKYLSDLKSVRCVLVAYWPNLNPVKAPLDGFELGGTPRPSAHEWTEKERKDLKYGMENWPRDEKGRFLPSSYL